MVSIEYSGIERSRRWFARLVGVVRGDAIHYALIFGYTVLALAIAGAFGRTYWADITSSYFSFAVHIGLSILLLVAAAQLVRTLVRDRPPSAFKAAADQLTVSAAPEKLSGLMLYCGLSLFMGSFTTVKTLLPELNGFWFDRSAAAIDRFIHFGHDPWSLAHAIPLWPPLNRALEFAYSPGWLLLTGVFPLVILVYWPDRALKVRFALSFLLAWIVNGGLIGGLFMSGGPIYYGGLTGDTGRFASLAAWALAQPPHLFSAATQQNELWSAYVTRGPGVGAGISAFPSMHVTMCVICALAGWTMKRKLGAFLFAYAALILFGSVYLGWHYAIDGYFAIASAAALWWLAGRMVRAADRAASA